jgi:hypothetical protein
VHWPGAFARNARCDILLASLRYCRQNKGLEVSAWVAVANHVHLIIGRKGGGEMQGTARSLKNTPPPNLSGRSPKTPGKAAGNGCFG